MTEMEKSQLKIQNVALVYLERPTSDAEEEIAELHELVRSALGEVKLFCRQSRTVADPKTLIGSGKVKEIKSAIECCDCTIDVVVFSEHLNAMQRKNLQDELDIAVIDNIDLILDIFALRATSAEGKKQVELAQLSYSLATRPEKDYSRQGGGIGTRGPGETQLETDKRIARQKIHRLREELAKIQRQRATTRKNRLENEVYTIALVGYTNAGKSTLFNRLASSDVYADDRLFATLDTTIRKISVNGQTALLCDTVGFIRNLPTMLIEAFKSTLDEVTYADLILNVCDASNPDVETHVKVTEEILAELGSTAPIVRVYNKCDKATCAPIFAGPCVCISALTGKNMDALLDVISERISERYATVTLKVPYGENGKIASVLQKYATEISVEYCDTYALYHAKILRKYLNLFEKYITII